MPGAPLSLTEREEISAALIKDPVVPWAVIAQRVGRHPTTIAREVTAHGGRVGYRPALAQRAAEKALCRPRQRRLEKPGELRDRVTDELRQGRSPEAIWADLVAEEATDKVCVETIYTTLYAQALEVTAKECLRSRRPRRRGRQDRQPNNRPALPNISLRPAEVNDRSELGHWEADQIIGANNRSGMLWLTERVTRFSIPVTMPEGYSALAMVGGLVEGLDRIPPHLLRSVTFDQGPEWAEWQTIADTYGIACWFCDPHSPWQRGQIENLNRQWRWWFPRGTDLAGVDPAHADHAAEIINGQRRRSLGYQSPDMLWIAAGGAPLASTR
jgi:IS30 family transposase